jgi:hypothetical protein
MGPPPRSLAAEANGCFMVRVRHGPNRIQGCGARDAPDSGLPSDQLKHASTIGEQSDAIKLDTDIPIQGCVKTPARFHTDLFCSLFRAPRSLGSEKIANNFAPRDCLQNFAEFSHGLGRNFGFAALLRNRRSGRTAGFQASLGKGRNTSAKGTLVCCSCRSVSRAIVRSAAMLRRRRAGTVAPLNPPATPPCGARRTQTAEPACV